MTTESNTIRIPMGASGMREVPFMRTWTPGIVITPAQNVYSEISFRHGCNLTHAPSGWRVAGTFQDVHVARMVAAALSGIMDWNTKELTDPRAVVVAVRTALKQPGQSSIALLRDPPKLLSWLGELNNWEVQK
jgi:hypothetical protein